MPDKIRWGILSTANIGRGRVIPAMHLAKNGEVAAVASRSLEKAQQFAQETGIPHAYGSYEELIAAPDIDAIYIPLPNSEHVEWSIRCAEAGKPTLCEKPLAGSADDAQRMVDAFTERGVLFAEAFMYRFHPQIQRVKQMITDGAIGRLHIINSAFTFAARSEDDVRLSKALAGGALRDVGCYCVNIMRLMTGEEPTRGQAFADFGAVSQVDERITGVLQFPSGVLGHFDASLRTHFTNSCELRGSEGRILLEKPFVPQADSGTTIHYWRGDSYEAIQIEPVNQYTLMAEDFADALINNRPPKYAGQDGVENMRALDMLLGAAERNLF